MIHNTPEKDKVKSFIGGMESISIMNVFVHTLDERPSRHEMSSSLGKAFELWSQGSLFVCLLRCKEPWMAIIATAQRQLIACWHTVMSRILTLHLVTLFWHQADQLKYTFLHARRQTEMLLLLFFKSFVRLGRESNLWPPAPQADVQPLDHRASK